MTLSSHQKRIATALVLVPVIIWIVFQRDRILAAGLFVVAGLGLYEYCSMFWHGRQRNGFLGLGLVLGGMATFAMSPALIQYAPLCMPAIFLILATFFLFSYSRSPSSASFSDLALLLAGVVYLAVMLQLVRFLAPVETMLVLVCAFATDTGGFYAGGLWGQRKIWPGISPKKTWAGSFGGMILTTLCSLLIGLVWGASSWWTFVILGVVLNIAAQMGDFFESALKRWSGVKDSGHILPGHGGIMDRIDSLLFALPIYSLAREVVAFF
ncbi:phosphatidate cytidylyltransferase [Desulfoplanes formicivorans]|uniref:Phosphatidate cytidylyltransferase n=1 Tax=Desulfoplanes formicivorans TaxID=1592317 RepID=A0A194AFL6_9BACT|nr:phosphatidate cytidylyltransferase [Desulfoplanes formicivorans]GAU07569.1 phosphatidate cytidylyltransferase [Desulfoplanes formicivorans]